MSLANKYTEGCPKIGNKYRLFETAIYTQDQMEKINIPEKLTESVGGKDLSVYGAYEVRIWNDKPNLNRRNYRRVIEQVIRENKVTYGFVNHPKDGEEDPARIYSVQKNPKLKNGWLVVEVYLIGDLGRLAESALQNGGPLTVSSSALGDVEANTGDVIPGEEFLLERYGDWVWGPSNGAYQFLKDINLNDKPIQEDSSIAVKELIVEKVSEPSKKEIVKENVTIYTETSNNTKRGDILMSDKLIETNLTFNIKGLLKECDTLPTLAEQKALLETALEAAEQLTDKTLFEDVKKRLMENIAKTVEYAEKGKTVDSLTESIKVLNEEKAKVLESIEKLTKEKEELVTEHSTLVKMYEDKQFEVSDSEKKTMDKLNENVKRMKARNIFLKKKNAYLTEKRDYFEALSNTKVDADYLVSAKIETEKLEEKYKKLQESLKKEPKVKIEEKDASVKETVVEEVAVDKFTSTEVEDYYNRIFNKDASVQKLVEKFRACATLREAQLLRMHTKDSTEPVEKKAQKKIEEKVEDKVELMSSLEVVLKNSGLF